MAAGLTLPDRIGRPSRIRPSDWIATPLLPTCNQLNRRFGIRTSLIKTAAHAGLVFVGSVGSIAAQHPNHTIPSDCINRLFSRFRDRPRGPSVNRPALDLPGDIVEIHKPVRSLLKRSRARLIV